MEFELTRTSLKFWNKEIMKIFILKNTPLYLRFVMLSHQLKVYMLLDFWKADIF